MNKLIAGLIIGIILGGVGGYFSHGFINKSNGSFMRDDNFQLSEEAQSQVKTFFDSNFDIGEINAYCQENRINCFYYCREINPSNEICQEIQTQRPLNWSRR